MGGNALDTHTERATPRHYLNVFVQVQHPLQSEWPDALMYLPRKHRTKQDHGDLDLLVRQDTVDITREWVHETFDPNDLVVNDGVWTFDLYNFQVDLVTKRKEYWEMSKAFFDQSGLGNLMGKLARWLRYKNGFQGLRMPVYRNPDGERDIKYGEFTLTQNPKEAFEFLGFDWGRFQEGFEDMEEIFEYVVDSEYFNHDAFQPKNMTADQRQRDRKRPVWDNFRDYLETVPETNMERPSQQEALERADKAFPFANLKHDVEDARGFVEMRTQAKEKFNGRDVMEEFGVEGKELGRMLGEFHDTFEHDRTRFEWIVRNGREAALKRFAKANDLDY